MIKMALRTPIAATIQAPVIRSKTRRSDQVSASSSKNAKSAREDSLITGAGREGLSENDPN